MYTRGTSLLINGPCRDYCVHKACVQSVYMVNTLHVHTQKSGSLLSVLVHSSMNTIKVDLLTGLTFKYLLFNHLATNINSHTCGKEYRVILCTSTCTCTVVSSNPASS